MPRSLSLLWLAIAASEVACVPAPTVERSQAALGPGHVLFLDLTGGAVSVAAVDDSVLGHSQLVGAAAYPAFAASVVAPLVSPAVATVALEGRVRSYYLPYDLEVVTARPATGDYAEILVGGTSAVLTPPQSNGIAGLAPVDCNDGNARSVGFAFSDSFAPQFGGVVSLAAAIAHEAGHGYGLQHVKEPLDPMYSVAQPQQKLADLFALSFRTGDYSSFVAGSAALQPERCGHADPLDDHALLTTALGPRVVPLSSPPTVALDAPTTNAVSTSFAVDVTATDDVSVARVEIYRDLELVAVLTQAPYHAELSWPVAGATTLTVEAIDADGQRATVSRALAVGATPMPDLASPVTDANSGAASDGGMTAATSGCEIAGPASSGAASVLLTLLLVAGWAFGRPRASTLAPESLCLDEASATGDGQQELAGAVETRTHRVHWSASFPVAGCPSPVPCFL